MDHLPLRYVAGVDLGGTKIEIGIVDERGKIIAQTRLSTLVEEGPQGIENQIFDTVIALEKEASIMLSGVGIGVPGQVDPQTESVLFAPNLNWHHVPLKKGLEERLKLPVFVVNDVRAITVGEWLYGAGVGCSDLLCVFIGTGIGSGVVSNGQLMTGYANVLGEVGHITIDYNGPFCTCGKQGCFEAIAGGWGIARGARAAIAQEGPGGRGDYMLALAGGRLEKVNGKVVIDAYYAKDALAIEIMELVEKGMIAGLASLVNVFNPARLILGGGVLDALPHWMASLEAGIRQSALKASVESLEIAKGRLKKNAGVVGGAAAVFQWLNRKGDKK